jgi:hypothetical protein
MSTLTIMIINIGAAAALSALLAVVMLTPLRVRRSIDRGSTHSFAALRPRPYDSAASVSRSLLTQVGRNG